MICVCLQCVSMYVVMFVCMFEYVCDDVCVFVSCDLCVFVMYVCVAMYVLLCVFCNAYVDVVVMSASFVMCVWKYCVRTNACVRRHVCW